MSATNQKYQSINELLPSFIDFLKSLPDIYDSDTDNAWENWIEQPEMHCDSGDLDVYSVLEEWATSHIAKYLDIAQLRENWLETSEGSDAFEKWVELNDDTHENGEDFPKSKYPDVNEMAKLHADKLIYAAHCEAYKINSQREDEAMESENLPELDEAEELHCGFSCDEILSSIVFIRKHRQDSDSNVTFMVSEKLDCLYARIVIEDNYISENLKDFRDTFYIPISSAELAKLIEHEDIDTIVGELKTLSAGRMNIHKNEHGACWEDEVYHPHS